MKKNLFVASFCIVILLLLVNTSFAQKEQTQANASARDSVTYTHQIINSANGTFGYDIYADGKLRVHQPTIPAVPGNEGFKTKASAEIVAKLVLEKIHKGEMPPTVSIEDMKKRKAL